MHLVCQERDVLGHVVEERVRPVLFDDLHERREDLVRLMQNLLRLELILQSRERLVKPPEHRPGFPCHLRVADGRERRARQERLHAPNPSLRVLGEDLQLLRDDGLRRRESLVVQERRDDEEVLPNRRGCQHRMQTLRDKGSVLRRNLVCLVNQTDRNRLHGLDRPELVRVDDVLWNHNCSNFVIMWIIAP